MSFCHKCGVNVEGGEPFCGNCGTPQHDDEGAHKGSPIATSSAKGPKFSGEFEPDDTLPSPTEAVLAPTENTGGSPNNTGAGSTEMSTGFGDTDDGKGSRGGTGGRRQKVRTLDPGVVLSNRYEIVRKIGGGGMGAVYLAKDRNLGDAPRAVKEMIQANLDESQHEKAINDFRRESLL